MMHRDPTFEQAHANLEREKRKAAELPVVIMRKRRRIQAALRKTLRGKK